jgi:hypothetical protein
MTRRLMVPFTFAAMIISAAQAVAQAPPPSADTTAACKKEFSLLRAEAEERGKLLRAASERHALPDEACKLIGRFIQSEIKMIKYVEANAARCAIPQGIADQLRAGHKNTEFMQTKVCNAAQEAHRRGPVGPTGDFDWYRDLR